MTITEPCHERLCNQGGGGSALVPPGGGEDTDRFVVAGEAVDTGLNENEAELGVTVLAVDAQVLADGDSLLDEHVEVLWDLGGEAGRLENTEDLVAGNNANLGDTVRVTEDLANPGSPSASIPASFPCGRSYWEGVAPFFASLQICSTTCSGVVFNHAGGLRE